MKGYSLRAKEPSRETQISREIFEQDLHIVYYWSGLQLNPPIGSGISVANQWVRVMIQKGVSYCFSRQNDNVI